MAASPSAATGATGLERLLLIFLINFSEPQEYSKQHFHHDRNSDQSEKTQEIAQEPKNTANLRRKPQKNSNFHQTDCAQATKDLTPPIESQTNGTKHELTERNSKKLHTTVAPAHNRAENLENFHELTLWMGASFTRPHGGRLMILPVDRSAGECLVKGSTCAPLTTFVPSRDLLQEPAKKRHGAAAADRTPTLKSVTVSPNTKNENRANPLSLASVKCMN